jgi:hypothetical protein
MKTRTLIVFLLSLVLSCSVRAQDEDTGRKTVIVGGQVVKPGPIDFKPDTTIYAMIMAAGGKTEFGSLKRVDVFRDGKILRFDLTDEKVRDKELAEPNDTIDVGMRFTPGR